MEFLLGVPRWHLDLLLPTKSFCAVRLVAQSCPTICNLMDCSPPDSSVHGGSPGKNTGVGCHALLQGNLPHPGIKSGSPASPALAGRFFTTSANWESPLIAIILFFKPRETKGWYNLPETAQQSGGPLSLQRSSLLSLPSAQNTVQKMPMDL